MGIVALAAVGDDRLFVANTQHSVTVCAYSGDRGCAFVGRLQMAGRELVHAGAYTWMFSTVVQ